MPITTRNLGKLGRATEIIQELTSGTDHYARIPSGWKRAEVTLRGVTSGPSIGTFTVTALGVRYEGVRHNRDIASSAEIRPGEKLLTTGIYATVRYIRLE